MNARRYGQKLYALDASGALVGRIANRDGGEWLPDDAIPETLLPLLGVFFEEMWPVLRSSAHQLRAFIASDSHETGGELPGKTFSATPDFFEYQTQGGALTHRFEIGGIESERMVVPYQMWMLGRIEEAMAPAMAGAKGRSKLEALVGGFHGGSGILDLTNLLDGCRVRKTQARLFSIREP